MRVLFKEESTNHSDRDKRKAHPNVKRKSYDYVRKIRLGGECFIQCW